MNGRYRLQRVLPPYQVASVGAAPLAWRPQAGEVLLIDSPPPTSEDGMHISRLVRAYAADFPVAIVVRFAAITTDDGLRAASAVGEVGAATLLGDESPLRDSLFRSLTVVDDVPSSVIRCVSRIQPLTLVLADHLQRFGDAVVHDENLSTASARTRLAERTLRYRLRSHRLPTPERWHLLFRHIIAQLQLQQDPSLDTAHLARGMGYGDSRSYENMAARLFGMTPAKSRHLLGIEWRVARWWMRIGRTYGRLDGSEGTSQQRRRRIVAG